MSLRSAAVWLAAMALAIPPVRAQPGADQAFSRRLRPCVDYVGRGLLRFQDYVPIAEPDDILGHSIYRWRFAEQSRLMGKWPGSGSDLSMVGHALRMEDREDAVVFVATTGSGARRWVGFSFVWLDRRGRPFLPILAWPDPLERSDDWMPDAARRFARPVSYNWPQRWWSGARWTKDDLSPGTVERRGGAVRVLNGLYLADLPAMFAAAGREPCWR